MDGRTDGRTNPHLEMRGTGQGTGWGTGRGTGRESGRGKRLFFSWFLDITASAQSHMPVQLCIRPCCIWFGLFPQTSPKYVFFMNDFWMAHRHFYSDVSLHIYSRHLSQSRYTHVRRSLTHNANSNNTVLILNSSKVLFSDESLHIY